MGRLDEHRVALRSLRPADLDAVLMGRKRLADEGSIESVPDREQLRSQLTQWSRLRDGRVNLGIESDGRLIGGVQSFLPRDSPPASGSRVCEVGVSIYAAADRGLGLGTEAVGLFVDWLFRQGVERVEGGTAPGNKAMIAVFERLEFRREERHRAVRYWLSRP